MMGGQNPWLAMWTRPRAAMRAILRTNPKYGVIYLATGYALQSVFYFFNYWSLGMTIPFYLLVVGGIVASPFLGMIWLYIGGWILHFTGKWLKGTAPVSHLRAALAWSKIPTSIDLLMWIILLIAMPSYVFILDAPNASSVLIGFVTFLVGLWAFVLLVQSIREVQSFSLVRSLVNVVIAWIISAIIFSVLFSVIRYLYVLTV